MVDEAAVVALARKYALQNAVQHGGQANPGAVVGKIMGEAPDLRAAAQTVMPLIQKTVKDVNGLDADAQKAELAALDPSLMERKKRERGHPFKTLPRFDDHDQIVMRFAPNPNGPATLGHSRGMVTMSEYKRIAKAAGKDAVLVLRFDDTDPQVKPPHPPAYKWIEEDYAWLGETPERIVRASDRNPEYYAVADQLIEKNAAYVCFCSQADAKASRDAGKPCPHRDLPVQTHQTEWAAMQQGKHADGTATLRIKTEVNHKDPALRDWVAFRVASTPHPMVGDAYKVWPMLDFESAVEDHLQGVTHIIRGKDLMDSTRRQKFLYEHMGWAYPETLYWGRVRLDEIGKFSSSGMRKDIEAGKFTGWDDPRLPTLRALRRRGFHPDAIRNFWVQMGLSEKDVAASLVNLYAESAKVLEPTAGRYFFVADPVTVHLEVPSGIDSLTATTARHPDQPERGMRENTLAIVNNATQVQIPRVDLERVEPGSLMRLKDLGNIRFETIGVAPRAVWDSKELDVARAARAPTVQWTPVGQGAVPLTMLRPEPSEDPGGIQVLGVSERAVIDERPGAVVQFERYGYARIETVSEEGVRAVFAHP